MHQSNAFQIQILKRYEDTKVDKEEIAGNLTSDFQNIWSLDLSPPFSKRPTLAFNFKPPALPNKYQWK
jgi:hypothetical protein